MIIASSVATSHSAGLLADIGGTNARFAYLAIGSRIPSHEQTIAVAKHATPLEAIQRYLTELRASLGNSYKDPKRAALAVATAVQGDWVQWTNCPWAFSQTELRAALSLQSLHVLNDFEALALSLPHLAFSQLQWRGLAPFSGFESGAMLAVVGPGTGLGVAGLKHHGGGANAGGWIAIAGEGGHASLGANNPMEAEILKHLAANLPHVSAERLLCGSGLPLLHNSVLAVHGKTVEGHAVFNAAQIVSAGLTEPASMESVTVDVFCSWLGSFCGNVALTLGARAGLYVGGGIVPRLGERFFMSQFRQRFEAKGRFESYLAAIPTPVITNTQAALLGAAQTLNPTTT